MSGNSLMILSLVINLVMSAICIQTYDDELASVLTVVLLPLCAFQLVGIALLNMDQIKIGKIIYLIGIVGFVPIGLIGVNGYRKFMDEIIFDEDENDFDTDISNE